MLEILCKTEKDMQRLGQSLGACMRVGDVVLLTGEMGAGKSVLTRAAARAMGVEGPVPSPTFTILNIHEGRAIRLYHFDLYRLSDADELYGMGLDEYIPAEDGASRVATLEAGGTFDEARIDEIKRRLEADDEHPDD